MLLVVLLEECQVHETVIVPCRVWLRYLRTIRDSIKSFFNFLLDVFVASCVQCERDSGLQGCA